MTHTHQSWNATQADVELRLDWNTADQVTGPPVIPATVPSATAADLIWKGQHYQIYGKLRAAGLTPSDTAGSGDTLYLAAAEQAIVGGVIAMQNEMQTEGEVLEYSKTLLAEGWAAIKLVCESPDVLAELGASLNADETPTTLRSHVTDYPNDNESAYYADLQTPLPDREIDGGDNW